jgi:hypothetical protein
MSKYDGAVMHVMRNRINHNYSLHEMYAVTIGNRNAHLAEEKGTIIINIENFVEEIGIVLNKWADDLRQNRNIRNNALATLNKYEILNQATMDVVLPKSVC